MSRAIGLYVWFRKRGEGGKATQVVVGGLSKKRTFVKDDRISSTNLNIIIFQLLLRIEIDAIQEKY